MTAEPKFQKIAIIGVGLIGASMARAIREAALAREIVGYDRLPTFVRAPSPAALSMTRPRRS